MIIQVKSFFFIKDIYDLAQKFFYLGIFLLPSALPISALFFILSLIIYYRENKINLIKDKWNIPIIGSLFLIIISTINTTIINVPDNQIFLNKSNIFLGLFNWLPLFFAYWGFQKYLKTESQRIIALKFLISGSIPVYLSCIMQISKIFGPFKSFFGLIIWFNKPYTEITGLTGLFSNPNYLGIFLTIILPFIFYLIKVEKDGILKKVSLYILLALTILFALATNSRNAFLGIIISLFTLINEKKIIYFLSISLGTFLLGTGITYKLLPNNILNICSSFRRLVFCRFFDLRNDNFGLMTPRIKLWNYVLTLIKERPIFGWGSSTFPEVLMGISTDIEQYNHTHNLFLEIAYNFGIPVSIILSLTTISIFIITFREVIASQISTMNKSMNKAWLASIFTLLFAHISDVTYYDGKVSLLFVILIAGLRCILKDIKELKI